MDLTIYDIIQGPIVTDKASSLMTTLKKVVLKVHPSANKPMIKEALEKLFKVKVENINIIVRKGKVRSFKRMKSVGSLSKRAVITLKQGYSLDTMVGPAATAEGAGHIAAKEITTIKK